MEYSFFRSMSSSYLVVKEEAGDGLTENTAYDQRMVLENTISGLLKSSRVRIDDKVEYRYDISRMQAVSTVCEQEMLDFETMRLLIEGLAKLEEQVERFLLKPNKICYRPNLVFLDMFHNGIACCYDLRREVKGDLGELKDLFSYILTKINHRDAELVEYAYMLFEASQESNFSVRDWVRQYNEKRQEERNSCNGKVFTEEVRNQTEEGYLKVVPETIESNPEPREDLLMAHAEEEDNLLYRIVKRIREYVPHRRISEEEEETYYFQPENLTLPAIQETVFFQPQNVASAFMQPRKLGDQPIALSKENKLVGKEQYADVALSDQTVSRIHAVIRYDSTTGYSVEDLNSTNGTFVNGHMLQLKESIPLKNGDIVTFGCVEYAFCNA